MIEQVLIKKTLKAGETIWEEGSILNSPLPKIILEEIRVGTNTVEVLKKSNTDPNKLVFVAEKVGEIKNESTTTSQVKTESGLAVIDKPKPKLIRRKKK